MLANVLSSEELMTEAKKELGEDEARVEVILLIKQALFSCNYDDATIWLLVLEEWK